MLQCSKDTDCKGDRICDNGSCKAPAATQGETLARQPATLANDAGGSTTAGQSAAAGASATAAANTSAEYQQAYKCGIEVLAADPSSDPLVSCVGNSHDPSKDEERGFADAKRNFFAEKAHSQGTCPFAYAIWIADGSHADDFVEGPKKETTLRAVLNILPSREDKTTFYDKSGAVIDQSTAASWFTATTGQYGERTYHLSNMAKKSCSKQQLG